MDLNTSDLKRDDLMPLVQQVFGLDTLNDVLEIIVRSGSIEMTYYARDSTGTYYYNQGELVTHCICRRLV